MDRILSGLQYSRLALCVVSAGVVCLSVGLPAKAQLAAVGDPSQYPACRPPAANEYLLLVASPTEQSQTQVKQVLPANTEATVCNYLNEVVTRVTGFSSIDSANSWAKYLTEVIGVSAFVAKPSANSLPVAQTEGNPNAATPRSTAQPLAYNPKALGDGYAVLVNYFNKPEIATQIQQLLGQQVGLAAYGQRPYLLATYTANQQDATSVSQALNDRGFSTMIVDSRQVTLLTEAVNSQ